MTRCFFELRSKPIDQTTFLTADIMRHLHSRQYLGKVIILCTNPFSTMRVARKQWLKLARTIQRQRSSTINADKILRFTYAITHMQHMQFSAKTPLQSPETHVFFVAPNEMERLPLSCYTVYITTDITDGHLDRLLPQLADSALVVDYTNSAALAARRLEPKARLEKAMEQQWKQVQKFTKAEGVSIRALTHEQYAQMDAMDAALDTLLGVGHEFLRIASAFQHAFELAQPYRSSHDVLQQYNTMMLLAYRVQALTPGVLSTYMMRTYHEDETYFLHDIAADLAPLGESIPETISRHQMAGRQRLADALQGVLEKPYIHERRQGALPESQ